MKTYLLAIVCSICAFLIGCYSTSLVANFSQRSAAQFELIDRKYPAADVQTSEPLPSKVNVFDPEFRNLPNFDELDYSNLPGKLIDLNGDGIFRRSEVVAKNGEPWLVLIKDDAGYLLRSSTANVKKLRSVSWPGDEKDAKLSFHTNPKPIFALKNIRGLNPGPVETLFLPETYLDENADLTNEEFSDGYWREFVLDHRSYVLRTSRGLTKDGTELAVLVLESEGATQVVDITRHVPGDRDIIGSLLWAGDLDNDGNLDLYFDHFNEMGSFHVNLYLSSHARAGQLLGIAAAFGTAGC